MNQFYVSLIFFGIILIVFSLIWVVLDKKKVFSFVKNFDQKKQELVEIINDAEQMIEELNKFSDYIVTQMDLKNEELRMHLKQANDEIKNLSQRAQSICGFVNEIKVEAKAQAQAETIIEMKPVASAVAVNGGIMEAGVRPQEPLFKYNSNFIIENMDFEDTSYKTTPVQKALIKKTEKVIPINNKYREVLRLSESGFCDVEIAKKLNMGIGEIELILGISK